jgi:hypothetical protein
MFAFKGLGTKPRRKYPDPEEVARWANEEFYAEQRKLALEKKRRELTGEPEPEEKIEPKIEAENIPDLDSYIALHDIKCVDADGDEIESYPVLYVAKDVERKAGNFIAFKPYDAILHFESKKDGSFAPSMALSCNILAALFKKAVKKERNGKYTVLDADAKAVLDQYKDYGPNYGWHAQNTLIDWLNGKIIHYPSKADFPEHGGTVDINVGRARKTYACAKNLSDKSLADALKDVKHRRFLQNLTGLQTPEILIEIAEYFGRAAWSWIASGRVASAWLGCNNDGYFVVDADGSLYYADASRGVNQSRA